MKFLLVMIEGYANPSVQEVTLDYFNEENGFDIETKRTVGYLSVGIHNTFLMGTYQFTVKRVI